jgi:hypothetical protein
MAPFFHHFTIEKPIMYKKVSIPLQKLLDEGTITQKEAERILELSEHQSSGSILRNIMVLFGAISIIAGILGIMPNPHIGALITAITLGGSYYLYYNHKEGWNFVAQSLGMLSTLGLSAWLIYLFGNNLSAWLLLSLFLGVVSFTLSSRFLAALIPFSIGQLIGMGTFYSHASYSFSIEKPSLAIAIYGILAFIAYLIGNKLKGQYENLCIIISRVSLFLVNMAFWIGSLWGDNIGRAKEGSFVNVPEYMFTLGWAIGLIALIIWGTHKRNIYVVNLALVFLSIHGYTQYFEAVGVSAVGLLLGGIILFTTSLTWWKLQPKIKYWVEKR